MNFNHFLGLFRKERIDPVIVCNLPKTLAGLIGAKVTRVRLSPETLEKQASHHPDLLPVHYEVLRAALHFGEYRRDGDKTAVVLFIDTKYTGLRYRAYVKATENGREIYVTSFCLLGERQYRAELRKPYPVIRAHLTI